MHISAFQSIGLPSSLVKKDRSRSECDQSTEYAAYSAFICHSLSRLPHQLFHTFLVDGSITLKPTIKRRQYGVISMIKRDLTHFIPAFFQMMHHIPLIYLQLKMKHKALFSIRCSVQECPVVTITNQISRTLSIIFDNFVGTVDSTNVVEFAIVKISSIMPQSRFIKSIKPVFSAARCRTR